MLKLVALALLVGVLAGLGAVFYQWLLDVLIRDVFGPLRQWGTDAFSIIWVPALGGLLVGPLIVYAAKETPGSGIPQVIQAMLYRGGRIRTRVAPVKAIASCLTIASGGSAGTEGPIVQVGASLGSGLAQFLKLSEEEIRLLLACGAAAGISAIFDTPLAGVFFAMEVVLAEFATRSFGAVVLASVTSAVISNAIKETPAILVTPTHTMESLLEFPWYLSLGLLAALVSVAYIKLMGYTESAFSKMPVPQALKPALGGLGVGLLALIAPRALGTGYVDIEKALTGDISDALLMLALAKLIATCLTVGSGGAGGVFAPSLFIGAMLGAWYGRLAQTWTTVSIASEGAYAMVGMAAVFAATTHAPITAIMMIFEMTHDYRLILPLMAGTVVSTLISSQLHRDSIYSAKLRRMGLSVSEINRLDYPNPMKQVLVGEVMTVDFGSVKMDTSLRDLAEKFNESGHHGFPVLDDKGRVEGMVTLKDLEYAKIAGVTTRVDARVSDIASRDIRVVFREDTAHHGVLLMGRLGVGRLPVVESAQKPKFCGVLRRSDVVQAYHELQKTNPQFRTNLRVGTLSGASFLEIVLPEDSPLVGRKVAALNLPEGSVLVSVRRGEEVSIPHGSFELFAGDVILAYTLNRDRSALRQYLRANVAVKS
jgi:chloride channel protein, CIC family